MEPMPMKDIEIINGYSRELIKETPNESIHLIVTDPPYYIIQTENVLQ